MMKEEKETSETRRDLWLWIGLLLPMAAAAIFLETLYLLSEYGCQNGFFFTNHIASALALFTSLLGGAISFRNWRHAGSAWPDQHADPADRSRFMAVLGILLSALLSTLIFAQWLPTFMGVPCGE
jgi:hypothetical protein